MIRISMVLLFSKGLNVGIASKIVTGIIEEKSRVKSVTSFKSNLYLNEEDTPGQLQSSQDQGTAYNGKTYAEMGAIIGGVVGSILFVLFSGVLAVIQVRRTRERKEIEAEEKRKAL